LERARAAAAALAITARNLFARNSKK